VSSNVLPETSLLLFFSVLLDHDYITPMEVDTLIPDPCDTDSTNQTETLLPVNVASPSPLPVNVASPIPSPNPSPVNLASPSPLPVNLASPSSSRTCQAGSVVEIFHRQVSCCCEEAIANMHVPFLLFMNLFFLNLQGIYDPEGPQEKASKRIFRRYFFFGFGHTSKAETLVGSHSKEHA